MFRFLIGVLFLTIINIYTLKAEKCFWDGGTNRARSTTQESTIGYLKLGNVFQKYHVFIFVNPVAGDQFELIEGDLEELRFEANSLSEKINIRIKQFK